MPHAQLRSLPGTVSWRGLIGEDPRLIAAVLPEQEGWRGASGEGGDTARSGDRAPLATALRPAVQVLVTSRCRPLTLLRSCARAVLCGDSIAAEWL